MDRFDDPNLNFKSGDNPLQNIARALHRWVQP